MTSTMENLEKQLRERLSKSRVKGELEHLSGQYFGGTLLRTFAVTVGHAAIIISAGALFVLYGQGIYGAEQCTHGCFWSVRGQCCPTTTSSLQLAVALLSIAFIGSLLSTTVTKGRYFQRSALVSALVLMSSLAFAFTANGVLWFTALFQILLVIALYCGYRMGLGIRNRAVKKQTVKK